MIPTKGEQASLVTREALAQRAQSLYDQSIRDQVDNPPNIGKMVMIDVDTGDFSVDDLRFDSAKHLRDKNPSAHLVGIRIGYNVAASLGGMMTRTST